jgi:molecular chaperone GrpE
LAKKDKQEAVTEPEVTTPDAAVPADEESLSPEEVLQNELAAQQEKFLLLAAEYDNFRKRTASERAAVTQRVQGDTVMELLPALDNLQRALDTDAAGDDLRRGLELTLQQLGEAFAKLEVTSFGAVGDAFDPKLHNAVQHVEDEELGENVLSAVFQTGYRLGDNIIRHAMVVVAN